MRTSPRGFANVIVLLSVGFCRLISLHFVSVILLGVRVDIGAFKFRVFSCVVHDTFLKFSLLTNVPCFGSHTDEQFTEGWPGLLLLNLAPIWISNSVKRKYWYPFERYFMLFKWDSDSFRRAVLWNSPCLLYNDLKCFINLHLCIFTAT